MADARKLDEVDESGVDRRYILRGHNLCFSTIPMRQAVRSLAVRGVACTSRLGRYNTVCREGSSFGYHGPCVDQSASNYA